MSGYYYHQQGASSAQQPLGQQAPTQRPIFQQPSAQHLQLYSYNTAQSNVQRPSGLSPLWPTSIPPPPMSSPYWQMYPPAQSVEFALPPWWLAHLQSYYATHFNTRPAPMSYPTQTFAQVPPTYYSNYPIIHPPPASAATQALTTAELLENILLHVDMRTLLLVQRVDKCWRESIARSPSLQRKLFFTPATDIHQVRALQMLGEYNSEDPASMTVTEYEPMNIPLAESSLVNPLVFDKQSRTPNTSWIEVDRDQVTPSWQKMYLTQPPIVLPVRCTLVSEDWSYTIMKDYNDGDGLRLGDAISGALQEEFPPEAKWPKRPRMDVRHFRSARVYYVEICVQRGMRTLQFLMDRFAAQKEVEVKKEPISGS